MQENIAKPRGRVLLLPPGDIFNDYWAAMAPVATATFSPNGSWGDFLSDQSLAGNASATVERLDVVPVEPFSVNLRGMSDVD
jgi:hypothetical protein